MNQDNQHPKLSAEDRAAVAHFIEKCPEIYQRWLARRQAVKAKQEAVLQHIRSK